MVQIKMPKIEKSTQWNNWQWQLENRITDIKSLPLNAFISEKKRSILERICRTFHMSITPYYASLINWSDPEDPLLLQSVPSEEEMTVHGDYTSFDPLDENNYAPVKGLVHKYRDRALFLVTDFCPVYCRYCTRKRQWAEGERILSDAEIDTVIGYIREHKEIRDVIVSGGDPLVAPLACLESILKMLHSIAHVEIIRIGTRVPVVLPQRIDNQLLKILEHYGPVWINTQFNHPREITPESAYACDLILRHGIPINNQTVLLKGINDNPEIIRQLNQKLLKIKVRPYYLFQCDCIVGAEHFITSIWKGIEIIDYLRKRTSGLAIPTYAVDVPGTGGKIPLVSDPIISYSDGQILVRDHEGKPFLYKWPNNGLSLHDKSEDKS